MPNILITFTKWLQFPINLSEFSYSNLLKTFNIKLGLIFKLGLFKKFFSQNHSLSAPNNYLWTRKSSIILTEYSYTSWLNTLDVKLNYTSNFLKFFKLWDFFIIFVIIFWLFFWGVCNLLSINFGIQLVEDSWYRLRFNLKFFQMCSNFHFLKFFKS